MNKPADGHRRSTRRWTPPELAVLREFYPVGGLEACTIRLPGRTVPAIVTRASALGLKAGARRQRRCRWPRDPHIDAALRTALESPVGRGEMNALAKRLGRPRWWLSRRARELDLIAPRFKEPAWTDAELELLHKTAHYSLHETQRRFKVAGFARSETAIHIRRKRAGTQPQDNGYYTAFQIAKLLGVDEKTITHAIGRGELGARKRGTARTAAQGGDHWWIREPDLRRFVVACPTRVDLRKIPRANVAWFLSMVAGPVRI